MLNTEVIQDDQSTNHLRALQRACQDTSPEQSCKPLRTQGGKTLDDTENAQDERSLLQSGTHHSSTGT